MWISRSQGRLNEAAAAADASRGLTGQLRCPKTKSAYHVRCQLKYPYKQLPCQTQGRLPSNGPIRSDPALKILLRPWSFLRRVTPDRVLAFPVTDPSRKAASYDYS